MDAQSTGSVDTDAQQITDALEQAQSLTEDLDYQQFNWRSAPSRWSIAECLVHFTETTPPYLDRIDTSIEQDAGVGCSATVPSG